MRIFKYAIHIYIFTQIWCTMQLQNNRQKGFYFVMHFDDIIALYKLHLKQTGQLIFKGSNIVLWHYLRDTNKEIGLMMLSNILLIIEKFLQRHCFMSKLTKKSSWVFISKHI